MTIQPYATQADDPAVIPKDGRPNLRDPAPVGRVMTPVRLPAGVTPAAEPIPDGETAEDREQRQQLQQANRGSWYIRHRPARYAGAALTDLDQQQDPDGRIRAWLDTDRPTLVMQGPVGTGKTYAAYAIANAAHTAGLLTVAVSVPDLLADLRPGGDGALGARARVADLLVLDDLGVEKGSDWTAEQLSSLLDARAREGRRQVVTTNTGYEQLVERLGERTMSRLSGGATVVKILGADRRAQTW